MKKLTKNPLVLAGAILLVFVLSAAIVLRIIPGPHSPMDYAIGGSLATLITLVILFALIVGISPGTFFRRK